MVISIKTNGIIKAPGNTDHNNTTSIIFYSGFKLQWGRGGGGELCRKGLLRVVYFHPRKSERKLRKNDKMGRGDESEFYCIV